MSDITSVQALAVAPSGYAHTSDPNVDALRWQTVRRAIATQNEAFGEMIASNADQIVQSEATPDQKEKALDDIVDASIRELNL